MSGSYVEKQEGPSTQNLRRQGATRNPGRLRRVRASCVLPSTLQGPPTPQSRTSTKSVQCVIDSAESQQHRLRRVIATRTPQSHSNIVSPLAGGRRWRRWGRRGLLLLAGGRRWRRWGSSRQSAAVRGRRPCSREKGSKKIVRYINIRDAELGCMTRSPLLWLLHPPFSASMSLQWS